MKAKKSISGCVREIKRVNAAYRRLKNLDGAAAQKLRDLKDKLIDEMTAVCRHPSVIATRGDKKVAPARVCGACGHCESLRMQPVYRALAGRSATYLSIEDFRLRTGSVLKRLGINL